MTRFRPCSLCGQWECVHVITEDMTLGGKARFWGWHLCGLLAALALFIVSFAVEYYTGIAWWGAAGAILIVLAALG